MFDYENLKTGTAEKLIDRFGKDVTLIQPGTPTGPAYDPTPGVDVNHPGRAVELTIKQDHIDGTLIQENDRMFLLSTKDMVSPELNYTFTSNGILLQVIRIKPLAPGPVVMLWKVQCRK